VLPAVSVWETAADSRNHVQALVSGWGADYPSPPGSLFNVFDCSAFQAASAANTNISEFCDRKSQRAMDAAAAAAVTDPAAAGKLWARADRVITDAAPAVPLATTREVLVLSPRARNYQHHPVWGVLPHQISLR
jgi:peptide/nickel transport system substrate-binding protein